MVWCTRRARETLEWLPPRARVEDAARLDALVETPEHQGVVAEVAPYPYVEAATLFDRENAFLIALDEVTDPHNLGAVARVAECAGAHGLVITRRRSAAVTAAACRASAGAVEHLPIAQVENLADALLRARRPGLWSYGAAADGETRHDRADYREGGTRVRARRRGRRVAAAGAQSLRHHGLDPHARQDRLVERVDGGGGAPVRSGSPARWLTRSGSSTATTSPTLEVGEGSTRFCASGCRPTSSTGRRGPGCGRWWCSTVRAADRTVGATLVCHSRKETADSVIERLAYRHAAGGEVTVVSNDTVVRHVSHRGGVHAMSAREFLDRLAAAPETPRGSTNSRQRYQLSDAVDPATREALERIRRGQQPVISARIS